VQTPSRMEAARAATSAVTSMTSSCAGLASMMMLMASGAIIRLKFVALPEIRRAAKARLPRDHWNFGDGPA
jgi:hypothetical protein